MDMATHNTKNDATNTAVRAFLTSVGEQYFGKAFNTANGEARKIWEEMRDVFFKGKCCYCGKSDRALTIEHLIMINREQFGLHHPGNIAPSCKECNKRSKNKDKKYCSWEEHLKLICDKTGEGKMFDERKNLILKHMNVGKYKYPPLSDEEKHSIRIIAEAIYEAVKIEVDKSLDLYANIRKAFVKAN
jgi:hypothetical protein